MGLRYIYNVSTHILHIEGLCSQTSIGMHYGENYKCFESEDEALAFDGRAVSMCKNCQQKRDLLLKEKLNELKKEKKT